MSTKPIEFPRTKNYILEKELGQGACGLTVLLYDPIIDERFVCKKYAPIYEHLKQDLFSNFVREIKLLYLLNHQNIVRVFSYYLYPDKFHGYIIMEYVKGTDIDDYLAKNPENVNEIFRQSIEGFYHLEKNGILHRDIRFMNLMVGDDGVLKIIDFGFGKRKEKEADFDKSISLNLWCDPPAEFKNGVYNFSTEIYFIGKLFEKIIADRNIKQFKHVGLLKRMCAHSPSERIQNFVDVQKELFSDNFLDITFDDRELNIYRLFSDSLSSAVLRIENNCKYYDVESVQARLDDCLKKVMLEKVISDNAVVLRCFLNGEYFYTKEFNFYVYILRNFVGFFRACSREKMNIIVSNLQTRLDSVFKYKSSAPKPELEVPFDDDIPF